MNMPGGSLGRFRAVNLIRFCLIFETRSLVVQADLEFVR